MRDRDGNVVSISDEPEFQSDDQIETETTYPYLKKDRMTGWITFSYSWTAGEVWADFQWEHDLGDPNDGEDIYTGSSPRDGVGMYWPEEDFDKEPGSYYTGHYTCTPENGSSCGDIDTNGFAVEYDDVGNYNDDLNDRTMGSDMGVKLYQQDSDVRQVVVDYIHTYKNSHMDIALSIGPSSGLVLNPESSTESWKLDWEKKEN